MRFRPNGEVADKMAHLLSVAMRGKEVPEAARKPYKLPTEMASVLRGWDRPALHLSHTKGVPAKINQGRTHTLLVSTNPLNVTYQNTHQTYIYIGINRFLMPPGGGMATVEDARDGEDRETVSYTCNLFGEVSNPITLPVGFTAGAHQPRLMHPHIALSEKVALGGESLPSISDHARVVIKGPKNHKIDVRNLYTPDGVHYHVKAFETVVPFEGSPTGTPPAEIFYPEGDEIARMDLRLGEAALIHPSSPHLLLTRAPTIVIMSGPENPAYDVTKDRIDMISATTIALTFLQDEFR